jgi:hypothetical protein
MLLAGLALAILAKAQASVEAEGEPIEHCCCTIEVRGRVKAGKILHVGVK